MVMIMIGTFKPGPGALHMAATPPRARASVRARVWILPYGNRLQALS